MAWLEEEVGLPYALVFVMTGIRQTISWLLKLSLAPSVHIWVVSPEP